MSELEQQIKERGIYITTTQGNSMEPMLRTGDKVMVVKPEFPLKKYDIPVYRRDDHYTMHRIVKVKKDGYVICGDNRPNLEKDITDEKIVGVFSGVYRGNRFVRADEKELLRFGKRACRTYWLRYAKYKIKKTLTLLFGKRG